MLSRTFSDHAPSRSAGFTSLLLVLALFAVSGAAVAQHLRPPRGGADAFSPDLVRRDLDVLTASVGLTEDQLPVLAVLFEDYQKAFDQGRDRVRDRIAELRPEEISGNAAQEAQAALQKRTEEIMESARREAEATDDPDEKHRIMTEAQERLREIRQEMVEFGPAAGTTPEIASMMRQMEVLIAQWERDKADLLAVFFADMLSFLDDDQRERWPIFERRLRRDRTLARGRLSAENVDLHTILNRFEIAEPQREAVDAALLRYAIALDAALASRNDRLPALSIQLREAEESDDADTLRQTAQRIVHLHQAVRDVNLEHAERLKLMLPSDLSTAMARVFEELAFPRTVRATPTGRMIDAAERLEGLSDEQKVRVQEIVHAYRTGIVAHNQAMRGAAITGEPQGLQRVLVQGSGSIVDAPDIHSARQARDEFEAIIVERLRAVLTPEQMSRIPLAATPAPKREDWGEGRPGSEMTPEQQELLKRFDADGDGRLDSREREALRRHLEGE